MDRIRDPIHGVVPIDGHERAIVDAPHFQRLRHVRQLGFSDLAFPGATHTRYSHALGACHVVGRIFDGLRARLPALGERDGARLRAAVRAATLLHDAGHPPFSHSSEAILPPRSELALPDWASSGPAAERASHEDFTLKILVDSDLSDVLRREYADRELPPEAIASLLSPREAPGGPWFVVGGVDHGPLLRQLVSSELDADRMDYLLRDSFYTGVSYGKYDLDWIIGGLRTRVEDGVAQLALSSRGIFAFEDFLLSRYHMFLSVYYHHTPTCFDHLLRLWYEDAPGELDVPTDMADFVHCDDVALLGILRDSASPWAERIVLRRPHRLLVESNAYDTSVDVQSVRRRLEEADLPHFATESRGVVSKYFGRSVAPIWVKLRHRAAHVPLADYTPLFRRYEEAARIDRVYVEPTVFDEASELVGLGD